ncbi:MAG: T9SS type A sorting domain-containing protein, partial [Bacteroidales bacterium]|nr:T9SS type A sorting domain-containing protein [Bacteroidales bacterium]
ETKTALFNVTVSGAVQPGTSVDLTVVLESGEYSAEKTFYLTIGLILEDFETGDFSSFPWQFGGNGNWIITATGAYEGAYCSKSGSIGNSETSELMVTMEVLSADSISFFRKVSSEEDYDYLEFYIDGVLMGEWSGEEGWSKVSFPVGPGNRTFKWVYSKDWYVTGGSDCAWIDYIVFPPVTGSGGTLSVNATATPAVICQGESSQLNAYASGGNGNYSFQWTPPTGLNNTTIPNPIATPTATITYTVTVSDGADVVTDQVTVTVHPVPETPIIQQIDDYLYSNAVDGNHWYNSNGPVQGATGQIFYPTATDYYYVIVTNTYGCESNPSNSIYFVFTGMEELDSRWIRVYPNPASDFWYVEMQIEEAGEVEVSLSGLSGKTIPGYGDTRILETGLHRMVFPADGLKPGIYLLQIRMNGSIRTIKLVIY